MPRRGAGPSPSRKSVMSPAAMRSRSTSPRSRSASPRRRAAAAPTVSHVSLHFCKNKRESKKRPVSASKASLTRRELHEVAEHVKSADLARVFVEQLRSKLGFTATLREYIEDAECSVMYVVFDLASAFRRNHENEMEFVNAAFDAAAKRLRHEFADGSKLELWNLCIGPNRVPVSY